MRAQARSIAKAVARGGGTSASCFASCSSAVSSEFCFLVFLHPFGGVIRTGGGRGGAGKGVAPPPESPCHAPY